MSKFIKVCPKCGHQNPEYENACLVCTYFIGMETPLPAPPPVEDNDNTRPDTGQVQRPSADEGTRTTTAAPAEASSVVQPTLYLQVLGSDRIFEVRDGWTVGQSHASSTADLQLRDLPGISYVHRNHCRFTFENGSWQVTPTDQGQFGRDFTNPTAVNQTRVSPGDALAINNGDQLSLGTLKVVVRII